MSYRVVHDMNTVTDNVAYLQLSGNISAQTGDTITQYITTGNAISTVLATAVNSKIIKVTYYDSVLTNFIDATVQKCNVFVNGYNTSSYVTKVFRPNYPKYYGISAAHSTTLTQDLNIHDANIHVNDALTLTTPDLTGLTPGVVYINSEKITFWTIDLNNNVLGQIRRAVDGTGAPLVHSAGSDVVEAVATELIPGGEQAHTHFWLNLTSANGISITDNVGANIADNNGSILVTSGNVANAVTDGLGLENSLTDQAVFLKNLQ